MFNKMVSILMAMVCVGVEADSIRCGSDLITVGETSIRLVAKCGEPMSRDPLTRSEINKHGITIVVPAGERWTYNFGPSQFLQVVIVDNGKVQAIETGDRGF